MALSNEDREEIASTIRLVVNGNIKRVEEKLDGHIEKHTELFNQYQELLDNLKPVSEAVSWINTTKKIVMWLAGLVAAVATIYQITK